MKTVIEYATRCRATVNEINSDSWDYGHTFSKLSEAIDWAENMIENRPIDFQIKDIIIWDSETGEILATCCPDEDEDFDNDCDYNEDMGFDPYLGCYTDDC